MECKYIQNELCTNPDCPMCADYCPVPDCDGVCRYEERVEMECEEKYKLTPKGCLALALTSLCVSINDRFMDDLWNIFSSLMIDMGYVQEEDQWNGQL